MQDLVQHDGVGHAVGKRHVEQIAVAGLRVGEPRALELHARIGQHVVIEIEAERAGGAGSKQLEHAPGAGAEIDEKREGTLAQRLVHGGLDLFLGHVQRADLVPLAGMGSEIGLRRFGAGLLHACGAGAVAGDRQIARVETRHDGAGERRLGAGLGQTEEHPAPLAEARDEARLRHQLQMPADAGLALPQDLGQILDVELGLGQQRENTQARGLAGGAQRAQGLGAGQAWGLAERWASPDIKICLYVYGDRPQAGVCPVGQARANFLYLMRFGIMASSPRRRFLSSS